jgi:hypothetical protein
MQVKGWTCRDTSPADYSASGWDASGPARFLRGRMLCLAKGWKSVKKCCDDGRGAGPALTNPKKMSSYHQTDARVQVVIVRRDKKFQ